MGSRPALARGIAWGIVAVVAVALGTLTAAALSGDARKPATEASPSVTPAKAPELHEAPEPPATTIPSEDAPAAEAPADTAAPVLDEVPQPAEPAPPPTAEPPDDAPIIVDDPPRAPAKGSRTRRSKSRPRGRAKPKGGAKQRLNDSMYPSG